MIDLVSNESQTWHHGLVARWWSEFSEDGPEIAYFRKFVERGQPALDVACGTGRLLIPFLADGLDVDGCDVSADMIALCRETPNSGECRPRCLSNRCTSSSHRVGTGRFSSAAGSGSGALGGRTRRRYAASMSTSSPAARSSSTTRTRTRTA